MYQLNIHSSQSRHTVIGKSVRYSLAEGTSLFNNNMEEIWKDVPGYRGEYQASNLGKIRSVKKDRKIKILSDRKHPNGYFYTMVCMDGVCQTKKAHRLVALTFIPNPENKPQVNHKNGVKTDNRVENIEWCTRSENGLHAHRTGLSPKPTGTKGMVGVLCSNSKQIAQMDLKGTLINVFGSAMEVERELGFTHTSISYCCIGKSKKSHGFIWKHISREMYYSFKKANETP